MDFNYFLNKMLAFYSIFLRTMLSISVIMHQTASTFLVQVKDSPIIRPFLEKAIALQYSCQENPMDGGAWWAAAHGVAKSQTQLKQLSSSSIRPFLEIIS